MPTQAQQRRTHREKQAAYEREWRRRIFYALRRQKAPFFKAAEERGPQAAAMQIDTYVTPQPLEAVLRRLYRNIGPKEAQEFYRDNLTQKAGFGFSADWFASVEEWLQSFLYDMISNMTQVTKKFLLETISAGLQNGDSYDQIIKAIRTTVPDYNRAATIARTETNRSLGWAKWEAAANLPYPVDLIWISARDKRTRGAEGDDKADHYHLNGVATPFGVPFTDPRSGKQLNFPGDVSLGAGAADTINCRCTLGTRRQA